LLSGLKRTDLSRRNLFFYGTQFFLYDRVTIEGLFELMINGLIHPVFGLVVPVLGKVIVLLSGVDIALDEFPDFINTFTGESRAGRHLGAPARFLLPV